MQAGKLDGKSELYCKLKMESYLTSIDIKVNIQKIIKYNFFNYLNCVRFLKKIENIVILTFMGFFLFKNCIKTICISFLCKINNIVNKTEGDCQIYTRLLNRLGNLVSTFLDLTSILRKVNLSVPEFNEFDPRLKSSKNRFQ